MLITIHNSLTTQLCVGGLSTIQPNTTESFNLKQSVYENLIESLLALETAGYITLTVDADPDAADTTEMATVQEVVDSVLASATAMRAGADGMVLAARIGSTAQRALTGLAAIDGITPVAGDVVLMKDQTDGTENGLYVAASGAWARLTTSEGYDAILPGAVIAVLVGTANARTFWLINETSLDVGTTDISIIPIGEANLTADLVADTAKNGASMVGVEDVAVKFTGVEVEAVLAEVATTAALAAVTTGNGAALVGVEDAATRLTGVTVEAALAECATLVEMAAVTAGDGAALVGIEDVGTRFAATRVEPALAETLVLGDLGKVTVVTGAEGAVAPDAFDVACTLENVLGTDFGVATQVQIRSFAVSDGEGDLAAAGAAVGTLVKVNNPAAGCNEMWMTSTAAGLFSFRCTNTNAAGEVTLVEILAEGCRPKLFKLTFAA
jgi:hypothetical protein